MAADFDVVPMVSIHPTRLNLYSEVVKSTKTIRPRSVDHLKVGFNTPSSTISDQSRRKINKAIEYLLFLARPKPILDRANGRNYSFKICFITLTLPSKQVHSDIELKKGALNQFLIEARKRWGVKNFIWRAEKQANGNLHFHVIADKFIPWSELRDTWNRIINKFGYVDTYRSQMREFHKSGFKVRDELLKSWSFISQKRAYETGKVNDWASPNSTDIHAVHKIKNIQAYFSKYFFKSEQNENLTGRLWGCNYELSNIEGGKLIVDSRVHTAIKKLYERFKPRVYSGEYFTSFYITFDMLTTSDSFELFKAFSDFVFDHFNTPLARGIPDI